MAVQASPPSGTAGIIDALKNLVALLLAHYGARGTLLIIIVVVGGATAWRIWSEWRKDKKFYEALVEKERTIKRLSLEVRMYKVLFFMQKMGWTEEQAEKFVIGNELNDDESNGPKGRTWLQKLFRKK
jgi:hypothetical protein